MRLSSRCSGCSASFIRPAPVPRFRPPFQKKTTAELRFVSNRLGRVEFIAGGFYTKERATIPTDVVARDMATNTQLPGPLGFILRAPVEDRYEELSAFGNLTFYLT